MKPIQKASGLLEEGVTPEAEPVASPAPAPGPDEAAVDAQQKAIAEKSVDMATELLYDNTKARSAVAKMIRPAPHTQGIGDAAALITAQTEANMKGELPQHGGPALLMFVVNEIIGMGAELGFFEPDEAFAKQAAKAAVVSYGRQKKMDMRGAAHRIDGVSGQEEQIPSDDPLEGADEVEQTGPGLMEDAPVEGEGAV